MYCVFVLQPTNKYPYLQYHEALYWAAVSITTVGYGALPCATAYLFAALAVSQHLALRAMSGLCVFGHRCSHGFICLDLTE